MGTKKIDENTCTTVSVRYYFDFNVDSVRFVPHKVIVHKVEAPVKKSSDAQQSEENKEETKVVYLDNVQYLKSLDPKEWKAQDHYRVLGIKDLRHEASDEVIKTAFRKMVLKHHPDKRKASGEEIKEAKDDYFICINMAYATLGTTNKRRAYDSVDPEFDNSIPSGSDLKKDFYEVFNYYFDLNARWSEKKPVPRLGDENSSREYVDNFYSFWYDFKSWREYSYEDEEDKEKCEDRNERRICEKINRSERQRKKKEEMQRIRSLVDLAYGADPRIIKFKLEDKERKLAAKRAKQSAAQAKREEEARIAKEAQIIQEKLEAQERARIQAKRQEREVQKKALKKERKVLRDYCKANNYFTKSKDQELIYMQVIDKMCEAFGLMELEDLNKDLTSDGVRAFEKAIKEFEERAENEQQSKESLKIEKNDDTTSMNNQKNGLKMKAEWTHENMQLLIKAVNLFPAGTSQRWEVVANFINQHGTFEDNSTRFNPKDVLTKAKDLQKTDFSKSDLKVAANKQAFDNFEKDKRAAKAVVKDSEISKRVESSNNGSNTTAQMNGFSNVEPKNCEKQESPWTPVEQQLLEQALKTYSSTTVDRWDRISECIPNRSKKECMKRYKELAQMVKAKNAAQATVKPK